MARRTRTRDLALPLNVGESSEIWELRDGAKPVVAFPVEVRLGKRFDVLRMKGQSADQFGVWSSHVRDATAELYAAGAPCRLVTSCPCCASEAGEEFCRIHGVLYQRCTSCA